ncbi:MAG: S41 family peptidase, partial [Cyclobacteriaceae bacterium]
AEGINHNYDFEKIAGKSLLEISRATGVLQTIPPLYDSTISRRRLVKPIANNLYLHFPIVLKGNSNHTFPRPDQDNYKQLLSEINAIEKQDLNLENQHIRMANIIKVWNVLVHFYPYFDLVEVDWDQQFMDAVNRNESDTSKEDHITTLKLMIEPLRDSHMGVYQQEAKYFLPIKWDVFENRLIVIKVLDGSILKLDRGAEITEINGKPWEDYWDAAYSRALGATKTRKHNRAIKESLSGKPGSKITFRFISSGEEGTVTLERNIEESDYEVINEGKTKTYFEIRPNIFYADLTSLSWKKLKENLQELERAEGIIFDLRGYPTWGIDRILAHMTRDTIEKVQMSVPIAAYPDRELLTFKKIENSPIIPEQPYLKAKKIFITDANAMSYSETLLNPVTHYNLAEIIGEQTAGSTGNTNTIFLLGGITIPWTGMKVLDQKGNTFQGIGIRPDIKIDKNIENIYSKNDQYLDLAIKRLSLTEILEE